MTDIAVRRNRVPGDLTPPTDDEKYAYIKGRQHRWLWLAHLISFVGIAISLYGLSRMTYWTLLFLLPLSVYGIETLLGVWTSTFRRRFTLLDHAAVVELSAPARLPAIDVFIPTCGEPLGILINTLRHVSRIEYAGELAVFVLDDAGDERVAQAAGEFGFTYLARPTHEFKKAGNLQYAFERTAGEHILLLDADFVPRPDILTEVVPHMTSDPHNGIVQTPQYYPTGLPGMGWLERCASATQETFYRFIQPSRDAVSAAVCCGTSALYRRSALEASGGFPQLEHSEDMFTGVEMMTHGFRTAFLPLNLTQGLCPADLGPFISQQYRWCAGSMQLMRTRAFHAELELGVRQRAAYWSGFLHYFTTAMNVFFAPLPLLLMVWIFPQYVRPANLLPLLGLLVLWLVVYPALMTHKWRLDVLRVQAISGFAHTFAIYDIFFGTEAEWVPSHGRGRPTALARRVQRVMTAYLTVTFGAAVVGVVIRLAGDYSLAKWWPLLAFMCINCYVFGPVVGKSTAALISDHRRDRSRETQVERAASVSAAEAALGSRG